MSIGATRSKLVFGLAAAALIPGTALPASSIWVQSANERSGTWAARLTVSRSCTDGDAAIPDGPLAGDPGVEPCGRLVANDVDVSNGPVSFRAGRSVRMGEGFSIDTSATFGIEIGASVLGEAAVRDESPMAERSYHARFFIDPDDLTLSADSQQFDHLVAYDARRKREFVVGVTFDSASGERRLFGTAFEDGGRARSTQGLCELALRPGWQYIEVHWKASDGTDGDLALSIDGAPFQSLASCHSLPGGLDNAGGEVSMVDWGVRNPTAGSVGSFDVDDFTSTRNGVIGGL